MAALGAEGLETAVPAVVPEDMPTAVPCLPAPGRERLDSRGRYYLEGRFQMEPSALVILRLGFHVE